MAKIKITIATVGHMPADFNRQKIKDWSSSIFEIVDGINSYALNCNSDGYGWEYTDNALEDVLPKNFNTDFLIAIVNVPLELNWYSRRLSNNRVVFSFHEIKEILRLSDIPLENIIYRLLYSYTLLYIRSSNCIPQNAASINFTHDETRGCLFDMNGIKADVIYSCHNPVICSDCVERLKRENVAIETIAQCQREIQNIQKELFYRIADFIKKYPLWSLAISAVTTIVLGVISCYVYDAIK